METAEILRWVLQLLRRSWRLGRLGVLIDLRTLRQHLLSPPTSNSRINCSAGATVDRAFCFGSSLSLAFGSTAVRTEFYTGERAGWYVASGWGISGAWMKCHVLTLTHCQVPAGPHVVWVLCPSVYMTVSVRSIVSETHLFAQLVVVAAAFVSLTNKISAINIRFSTWHAAWPKGNPIKVLL